MNAWWSIANDIAWRSSGLSNGGLSRLTNRSRRTLPIRTSQIACGAPLAMSLSCGIDAVQVGPVRLPIIPVAGHRDRLVRLEVDNFERTSADWMHAHLCR